MGMRWDELKKLVGDILANGIATAVTTTGALTAASLTATGDIAAAGGFVNTVGPFTAPGAAGVTAASQTNLDMRLSHTVTAVASAFVAPRAGSVLGLSAQISEAITGSGTSIVVSVAKNGTELVAGPTVTLTEAGGEVKGQTLVAKDAFTFAAGDLLQLSYTSTGITNTPALWGDIILEY